MKLFKNTVFFLLITFFLSSCAKNNDIEKGIDTNLLINNWKLTSQIVDNVNFTYQTNCYAFHHIRYNTDLSVDKTNYEEVGGNCVPSSTSATWKYELVNDVIEISIAGTVHFKYQILELTSTALKVKDITLIGFEEILMTYSKI